MVSENGAFVVTTGSVADLGDPDLPQPNAVCFMDGYFFFSIADGRCFASGLNATTIDATHFATAEGKPDSLHAPGAVRHHLVSLRLILDRGLDQHREPDRISVLARGRDPARAAGAQRPSPASRTASASGWCSWATTPAFIA